MSIRKFGTTIAAALLFAMSFVAPLSHADSMSNYWENKVVDLLFRGQTYTVPTTQYVALATTAGSDVSCGTEVTGGSYARASIASSLANWAGTQSAGSTAASSGTGGTTSNNIAVTWSVAPSANWGTVVEFCVFDASTAGNLLYRATLTASKNINSGDAAPSFAIGAITFQADN